MQGTEWEHQQSHESGTLTTTRPHISGIHFKTEIHIKEIGSISCKGYEKSDLSNTISTAISARARLTSPNAAL